MSKMAELTLPEQLVVDLTSAVNPGYIETIKGLNYDEISLKTTQLTAEAAGQALKGASLIKLLSSLALNWAAQLTQAIDRVSLANEQIKDRDMTIQQLKSELADLRHANDDLKVETSRLSAEKEDLQYITDSQGTEINRLKDENLDLKTELRQLRNECSSSVTVLRSQDTAALQTELTQAQNDLSAQADKLRIVSISEKQAKDDLKSALSEISSLKMDLEMEHKLCIDAREQSELFKRQLYDSKQAQVQLREDLARADNKLLEVQNSHDKIASRAREWADKADMAEQRLEEIGKRMEQLDINMDTAHDPEPPSVRFSSFGPQVKDSLLDSLSQRQRYQTHGDVVAASGPTPTASPSHPYGVDSDSPVWGKTSRSIPDFPSIAQSRDSRLRQLRELARDIEVFNPDTPGSNIELYLKDVNYALSYIPEATMADKLLLLRKTTVRTVHGFMERQSPAIAGNYNELCRALRAEYTIYQNPSVSRLSALQTKQNRYESPREYYERLRRVYFAGADSPRAEEDVMFKSLFVSNLHPTIRKSLSLLVDVDHMTAAELRQLAMRAWESEKLHPDKKDRDPGTHVFELRQDREPPLELEGSELPQSGPARPSRPSQPRSSEFQQDTQGHKSSRNGGYKSGRHTHREDRHRRFRDRSNDSHKQSSQKKKESKGTEGRDRDNLKQIQKILAKALKDLKSEEHTSTKEKDPPSKQ